MAVLSGRLPKTFVGSGGGGKEAECSKLAALLLSGSLEENVGSNADDGGLAPTRDPAEGSWEVPERLGWGHSVL